jgi:hypothetical protein
LTHVLVEEHAHKQRERVAAEQLGGGVVLGKGQGRHLRDSASWPARGTLLALRSVGF